MRQRSSYQRTDQSRGRRFLKRAWEFSWKAGLTLLIPILITIAWYVYQAGKFDLTLVAAMPERTVLIDRNGLEFGTIHGANRRLIQNDEIPPFLKQALFAREDARFLDHEGVDYLGLARATLRNLKDRDFTQGASTLSMQLARNSFDLLEKKSLNRKFLEIALTYRIESRFTKEEILTHYLNRIYFGSGCNGIEEAALTYFGQPTRELHHGQCALLVGIIRAPHDFSPFRNLEGAIRQRDEVLTRLVHTEVLTASEAEEIKNRPLQLRDHRAGSIETNHGSRVIRRPLEIVLDQQQITTGGLKVITSLDSSLQKSLENLVKTIPTPTDCQIAALALDPQSGDILGVVGCREEHPSGFNRALDSRRDLGPQMIEPLIGTIALERGHLPIPGNPVATGRHLRHDDAIQLLKRFGFEGLFGEGEDLYRGTLTASPLELAVAFATIIQSGSRPAPLFVRELRHLDQTLFQREPSFFPAFAKHSRLDQIPKILTGQSLPKTDHWTALLTPAKIIVVWIGHDQPKRLNLPDQTLNSLKKNLLALSNK